jgi:acyl-CoA dehydrogenase
LDRFVVLEELLAAGAPVAAHWIADRQSGPQIFRYGTACAREALLPAIACGEAFFAIGMSEPDSGSDLASVRTAARRVSGGWLVSGRKVWTTNADRVHFIMVLCRTEAVVADKHDGLSVLIVDLAAPGVAVRPIEALNGASDFAEVVFDDVFVPDSMLLGSAGEGWRLVTAELSLERSGPERILSTYPLLRELVRKCEDDASLVADVGALAAELWTLRRMSLAVAAQIGDGADPVVEAALVKDMGTEFERRVVEVARRAVGTEPDRHSADRFEVLLAEAILSAPGFSLRGGTSEILRGIVARGLGVGR